MLNIAIYDTSGTIKRATKTTTRCNLFCSIDAKQVESREYFYFLLKQNLYMLRVLLAQDKLVFAVSDVTLMYGVTPIIMILSNHKSVSRNLQQPLFAARQVWIWVVKRVKQVFTFYTFFSNAAKQVAHSCCPLYRSFIQEWKRFSKFVTRALKLFVWVLANLFRVKMLFKSRNWICKIKYFQLFSSFLFT